MSLRNHYPLSVIVTPIIQKIIFFMFYLFILIYCAAKVLQFLCNRVANF